MFSLGVELGFQILYLPIPTKINQGFFLLLYHKKGKYSQRWVPVFLKNFRY